MASITAGTSGTMKSNKIESLLIEIITFGKVQEQTDARNPSNKNYIQGYTITDTLFRANVSIPVTRTSNSTGDSLFTVPDYLTGVTFTPGTGGTFKSTNFAAYIVEAILYAQDLEANTTKNPGGADRITGNFDINPNVFTGSVEIPLAPSIATDGKPTFTATEYLLT